MKRFLILFFFFISHIFLSQDIKMDVKIINEKEIEFFGEKLTEYTLQIKLSNESNTNYAIPIDTTGYMVYYSGFQHDNIDGFQEKYLKFMPQIIINEELLEGESSLPPRFDDKYISILIQVQNKKRKQYERGISKWRHKYKLTGDNLFVNNNKQIFSNIKTIKAGETIIYIKKFSPTKMNYNPLIYTHDYYIMKNDIPYPMSLEIGINSCIYNFLTSEQKEKFKDYKFFSGKIQSNEIMIRK